MKKVIFLLAVLSLLSVMLFGCVAKESKEYTLTVEVQGQGDVIKSPSQGTYQANSKVDLGAIPDEGWVFDQWEGSIQGTTNPITITVDDNQQVKAIFVEESSQDFSDIWVYFELNPIIGYSQETPIYRAICDIQRMGENVDPNEFKDAIITVNNTPLELFTYDDNYYFNGAFNLKTGDLVQVKLEHSSFGTIEKTIIVPPSLESLSTDPTDLNLWMSGTVENLTLNWLGVDCDAYRYHVNLYDALGERFGGQSSPTTGTTKVLNQSWLFNWQNEKGTYVELEVFAINTVSFDGFYGSSCIEISSPTSPTLSNLPN